MNSSVIGFGQRQRITNFFNVSNPNRNVEAIPPGQAQAQDTLATTAR